MDLALQNLLLLLPMLAALVVAAAVDVRARRIPNWLTAGLAVGGLVAAAGWDRSIPGGLWMSIVGLLLGLAMNLPLFLLGIRGGGDVKLFAAVGAWLGPVPVVAVFIVSTVVALLLAVAQAAAQRRLKPVVSNSATIAVGAVHGVWQRPDEVSSPVSAAAPDRHRLPYAVPVLLSVLGLVAFG